MAAGVLELDVLLGVELGLVGEREARQRVA